jgi:hypothetical protein
MTVLGFPSSRPKIYRRLQKPFTAVFAKSVLGYSLTLGMITHFITGIAVISQGLT